MNAKRAYTMRYQDYPKKEFSHARHSPQQLIKEVNTFFSIPTIRDAMDQQEKEGCMPDIQSQTSDDSRTTYADVAERLRLEVNHTQKAQTYEGKLGYVAELGECIEKLNMFLKGSTLKSNAKPLLQHAYETPIKVNGLSIHFLLAMRHITVSHDRKKGVKPDINRTVADALHLGVSHESQDASIQKALRRVYTNCATKEQMREAYGYGPPLFDNIQGAEFGHVKIHEQCEEFREAVRICVPENVFSLTLVSELCTANLLKRHRPIFFHPNKWNIGPQARDEKTIDFRKGNIRQQFEAALHHVEDAVINYP